MRFSGPNRMACAAMVFLLAADAVAAQGVGATAERERYSERNQLEATALEAERLAGDGTMDPRIREFRRAEAWLLRSRLRDGDFRVGDRVVVRVRGETALTDTFTVRDDLLLQFPDYPVFPLRGVLRSELVATLQQFLARYMRSPDVAAVPLVRLVVSGEVGRPGFYHAPADALLSDVVMIAGGPSSQADLQRSIVRRGGDPLWRARDVQVAFHDGLSLDQFHLRGGDELVVGERRRLNWGEMIRNMGMLAGVISLLLSLRS